MCVSLVQMPVCDVVTRTSSSICYVSKHLEHVRSFSVWRIKVVPRLHRCSLILFTVGYQHTFSQCCTPPTNTVGSRLTKVCLTVIPDIQHKTARNGFLPMYFTPLIRKPRCPTPTRKFRNEYVKSIEKNTKPDCANCHLAVYYIFAKIYSLRIFKPLNVESSPLFVSGPASRSKVKANLCFCLKSARF